MDFDQSPPDVIAAAIASELGRPVDYGPVVTDGAARAAAMIALKTMFVEMVGRYRFLSVETEPMIENPSLVLKPTQLRIRVWRV